ncbi:uncharacterised protein [Colletotrichum tofieldiae]|nr:uncharacterised protein [Colletotrichum tofieldiae]
MNTENLPGLPTPEDSDWQWVDLFGRGALEFLSKVRSSRTLGKSAYFEDVNQDEKLELVCLDDSSRLLGFYLQNDSEWVGYTDFSSIPSQGTTVESFKQTNLTGNGLADMIAVDVSACEIVWYENLGEAGFGTLRRTANTANVPPLTSTDPNIWITLADMTGDGRADIVQVSPGKIVYWQNLSHGRFSLPVSMYGSPDLEAETFSGERLRLADINGSGTNDLIYLAPGGGLHIYLNQAGNGWSKSQILHEFPGVDQLSSVSTLDLLGKGTSCLCWTGKVPGSASSQTLFYVDLAPGPKPNCLASYQNGSGSRVEVSYKSSNWFYLRDQKVNVPWATKIGFPVQCVRQVTISDDVVKRVRTRTLTYHDGYYDAADKEFRGFGMVEVLESDTFNVGTPAQFSQPGTLTKTWYHTGAMAPLDRTLPRASSAALFESYASVNQTDMDSTHEFCQSLKGVELRREILGDDDSPVAANPFIVTDTAHQVFQLSPRTDNLHPGTYRCVIREVLSAQSDRQPASIPIYSHQLILETNSYNETLKSMTISYGRASTSPNMSDAEAADALLTCAEHVLSEPINDESGGCFRKPMPCISRNYRIVGIACTSQDIPTAFAKFSRNTCETLQDLPEIPYTG